MADQEMDEALREVDENALVAPAVAPVPEPEAEADIDELEYVPPPITGEALMAVTGIRHVLERKPKRITVADKEKAEMLPREIRRSVRRFVDDDGGPKKIPKANKFDYAWALDHLSVATEPKHLEAIASMFRPEDTALAAEYMVAVQRVVKYLQDILPIRVEETMAKTVNFDPSDTEIARFRRAFDVADDPMVVMRDLELGILVSDQVQHLSVLYPDGYALIKERMAIGMADAMARKKSWTLSWRRDRLVQVLFGTTTFSPALAKELQANAKDAGPPTQGPPPSRAKSSAASMAQTTTSEVAEGEV